MTHRNKGELHPREMLRALRDTGRFNATKLGDVERPEIWATVLAFWHSKRCTALRDAWDLDGFALFVSKDLDRGKDLGNARSCFYRLQRLHKRAGTAGPWKMKRAADRNDATTKAVAALSVSPMWSPAGDVSRFALDASIVLGDLLLARADAVAFSFRDDHDIEHTLSVARSKLLETARALRGQDVKCYFMPGPDPMLCFRWKDGRAGLNFWHGGEPAYSWTVVSLKPAAPIAQEPEQAYNDPVAVEVAEPVADEPAPASHERPVTSKLCDRSAAAHKAWETRRLRAQQKNAA